MFEFLDGYINFINNRGIDEIFIMCWHFFVFEFSKYIVLFFVVFLFYYVFQKEYTLKLKEWAKGKLYREYPLISVIVPGKNEGKNIYKLVQSLKNQTYQNYELIIVDDGSDDDTAKICKDLLDSKLIDKFISNPHRGGKASAANTALKFSRGKYVVHLDADSHLKDNAIEEIILPFYMYDNIGAVGGDVRINNVEASIVTALQGIEYLKSITVGRFVADKMDIMRLISGAFGAFRMDVLKRLGGWDVGPGLDGDITLKIRKLGFDVTFAIDSICYTNAPTKFKALAKQRFRWDRSIIRFRLRKHINILLNKNFKLPLKLAIIDNIAYNAIFDIFWMIYIYFVITEYTANIGYILLTNYLLYVIDNYFKFGLIIYFLGDTFRKKDYLGVLYLPLIPLYTGVFLRLVRIYAHFMEYFFRVSYYDRWNPWKVSRVVKQKGI